MKFSNLKPLIWIVALAAFTPSASAEDCVACRIAAQAAAAQTMSPPSADSADQIQQILARGEAVSAAQLTTPAPGSNPASFGKTFLGKASPMQLSAGSGNAMVDPNAFNLTQESLKNPGTDVIGTRLWSVDESLLPPLPNSLNIMPFEMPSARSMWI